MNIILPKDPSFVKHKEADINHFRKSLIKKAVKKAGVEKLTDADIEFLASETNTNTDFVKAALTELGY